MSKSVRGSFDICFLDYLAFAKRLLTSWNMTVCTAIPNANLNRVTQSRMVAFKLSFVKASLMQNRSSNDLPKILPAFDITRR